MAKCSLQTSLMRGLQMRNLMLWGRGGGFAKRGCPERPGQDVGGLLKGLLHRGHYFERYRGDVEP